MSARSARTCGKRNNGDDLWGNLELMAFATTLLIMAIIVPTNPVHFINWRFILYFLPFWYLGHCFSYLNGYYRHYGANPDKPIAWGVSSYGKIYNRLFFYNGYHAEHHFRPKVHWTKMEKFRRSIETLQKQEGVRTIKHAHMLGFLDPDLPKRDGRTCTGREGKRDFVHAVVTVVASLCEARVLHRAPQRVHRARLQLPEFVT